MKLNFKTFTAFLIVSGLGFSCASPTTRMPASHDKLMGTGHTQSDFNLGGRTKDLIVSLSQGTWCYAVYQGGNGKDSTSIIEIKSAVNDQCNTDTRKTATLGSDISLELMMKECCSPGEIHRPPLVIFQVAPVTTTQLLTGPDGSTNQWPIVQMKNGVVKFYNDRRSTNVIGGPSTDSRTLLELPIEFEDIVNDAAKGNGPVIIIIRDEIQEGKKGLNAVNVKLAALVN